MEIASYVMQGLGWAIRLDLARLSQKSTISQFVPIPSLLYTFMQPDRNSLVTHGQCDLHFFAVAQAVKSFRFAHPRPHPLQVLS